MKKPRRNKNATVASTPAQSHQSQSTDASTAARAGDQLQNTDSSTSAQAGGQPQNTADSSTSTRAGDGNPGPPLQDYLMRQYIPGIIWQLADAFRSEFQGPSRPNPTVRTGHTSSPPPPITSIPLVTVQNRSGAPVTVQSTSHGAPNLPGMGVCNIGCVAKCNCQFEV